jgi:hypothetical protein
MANHVHFTIHVEGIEDEQFNSQVKWEKRTIKDWNNNDMEIDQIVELEEQPFMDVGEKLYTEQGWMENSYDWYCDNVGAKWCHIEEMQDGYIAGYSAWRQPHEMVLNILEHFANKFNTEVSGSMTYEDEFRNFMGKQYYGTVHDDEVWSAWEGDYCETDADELMASFKELYPSIDTESEDFDYHGEYKVDGETIYPNEVLDEIADKFWEDC